MHGEISEIPACRQTGLDWPVSRDWRVTAVETTERITHIEVTLQIVGHFDRNERSEWSGEIFDVFEISAFLLADVDFSISFSTFTSVEMTDFSATNFGSIILFCKAKKY